jgi:hypothetical protein
VAGFGEQDAGETWLRIAPERLTAQHRDALLGA